MDSRVEFLDRLAVEANVRSDALMSRLRDPVRSIAKQIGSGISLVDSVRAAGKQWPFLFDVFDFRPEDREWPFRIKPEILFPAAEPIESFSVRDMGSGAAVSLPFEPEQVSEFLELFSRGVSGRNTLDQIRERLSEPVRGILEKLVKAGFITGVEDREPSFFRAEQPGIYRLQHSTLLFKTASAQVLVEPSFHPEYMRDVFKRYVRRNDLPESIDALVFSHSHGDHWHIPSILTFPKDIPIIVPAVPRRSFLCKDMARTLRDLGFTRVIELGWYSEHKFGDLRITALPFYGEQPTRSERPAFEELWQWGNTYLFETPDYRAWTLVDSGEDARGSGHDVARKLAEKYGSVDIVLGNLRDLVVGSDPIYGSGNYWCALSSDQMARFPARKGERLNLGPDGIAEVCGIVGARYFLPYAHRWREPLQTDTYDRLKLAMFERELIIRNGNTVPVPWQTGTVFHPERPFDPLVLEF